MSIILVTGFEPFGGEAVNPSGELATALNGFQPAAGWTTSSLLLPVTWEGAAMALLAAAESADAVIMLGQAGGNPAPGIERVATNVANGKDNAGIERQEARIEPAGPDAYFSTLPLTALVTALERVGRPVFISNSAGTYLCNFVFFRLMHHLAGRRDIPAGFIHLPYFPQQAVGKRPVPPSMAAEQQLGILHMILEVVAAGGARASGS